MARELNSPSAFEGGGVKNLIGGFSGTMNFVCESIMREFSEARIALRKSAFKNPSEHYSARMVRAAPFSKSLFDDVEKDRIELEFGKMQKPLHWEDLLKKKPTSHSSAPKPKPAPSQSGRGRGNFRGRGGSFQGSFRGKGGPFKSSGGGQSQAQDQKFHQGGQGNSRGRGGKRN